MPFDPSNSPVSPKFISDCLANVVHQDGAGSAGYRRLLDYIGISIDTEKSVVVMFHFGYSPNSHNTKNEEVIYNKKASRFYDIVLEQFGQHIMCDAIFLGNYLYVHIFNPRSDSDTQHPTSLIPKYSDLIETCGRIVRISKSELNIDIKAAVGRMVKRSITESARLLIELLRFQIFLDVRDSVIVEPDNSSNMKHLLFFPDPGFFPLIQNLLQAISEANESEIHKFIDQLVKCVLDQQPRTLAEFQTAFSILFSLVVSSMKTLSFSMSDFDCFNFSELFSTTGTLSSFKSELVGSIISLAKRYINTNSRSIDEIVARVRGLVEQRFTDPQLSVSELAAEVGISQPYLSSQFYLRNGISLLAYIHRCRIDYAKNLIQTTDLTIQEIAERAGYGHTATMYRSFRKLESITPGMYRSRLILSEQDVTEL